MNSHHRYKDTFSAFRAYKYLCCLLGIFWLATPGYSLCGLLSFQLYWCAVTASGIILHWIKRYRKPFLIFWKQLLCFLWIILLIRIMPSSKIDGIEMTQLYRKTFFHFITDNNFVYFSFPHSTHTSANTHTTVYSFTERVLNSTRKINSI
jgi:hypothetical protein